MRKITPFVTNQMGLVLDSRVGRELACGLRDTQRALEKTVQEDSIIPEQQESLVVVSNEEVPLRRSEHIRVRKGVMMCEVSRGSRRSRKRVRRMVVIRVEGKFG